MIIAAAHRPARAWGSRLGVWMVACVAVAMTSPRPTAADEPGFPAEFVERLNEVKDIYVGTQRKDGSRSSVVPVWFAYIDGAIWFASKPTSHKVKRVRNGSPIYVSASGESGPFVQTTAQIVNDAEVADRLGEIYSQKYWLAWIGYQRPHRDRLEAGEIVLLKLTPMR